MDFKKLLSKVLFYFIDESEHEALMMPVNEIDWDKVFNNTINRMLDLGVYPELENDNIVEHLFSHVMESDELSDFKHEQNEQEAEDLERSRDPYGYVGQSYRDFIEI